MTSTYFVTTTIPYVNARPHVGHAQEFILADAIARLFRLAGHQVILQSGTDENAFKNVLSAQTQGVPVRDFVAKNSKAFEDLVHALNVSADTFVRTTSDAHRRGVESFWAQLNPDDLYLRSYEGLYCTGCEDFYLERDLVDGLCPDHKCAPQRIQEENVFFRLSKYPSRLREIIAQDQIQIFPEFRKNEVLSFIDRGLEDISVTRSRSRALGWGIPAPGHDEQVIYVWIDALINYLSGQGYGTNDSWKSLWNEEVQKIHVVGKNVWKFHAVYWPALLLSAGLPLPNDIVVHGFLTNDGQKISKSLGNGVDPFELIEDYGSPDPLRHFLLHATPTFQDGDFSRDRLAQVYNADLANTLGNLLSRLSALGARADFSFRSTASHIPAFEKLNPFLVQSTSADAWETIRSINREITEQKPWELLKAGSIAELQQKLGHWYERFDSSLRILETIIPSSAAKARAALADREERVVLFPRRG